MHGTDERPTGGGGWSMSEAAPRVVGDIAGTIDKGSPVPFYYQLRLLLERAVADGDARARRADPDGGIAVRALRREPDRRPTGAERPRANRPRRPTQGQRHIRRGAEGLRVRRPVAHEPPRGPHRTWRAAADDGLTARGRAGLRACRCDARTARVRTDRAARAAALPPRRAARDDDRVHAVLALRSDSRARHE